MKRYLNLNPPMMELVEQVEKMNVRRMSTAVLNMIEIACSHNEEYKWANSRS